MHVTGRERAVFEDLLLSTVFVSLAAFVFRRPARDFSVEAINAYNWHIPGGGSIGTALWCRRPALTSIVGERATWLTVSRKVTLSLWT